MKHLNLHVYTVYYLLAFYVVNAIYVWNYFVAKESFDGKICNVVDLIFKERLLRSKMDCLIQCIDHGDCISVFLHENGLCVGCGVNYDTVFNPTDDMEGTKYYEIQNIGHQSNLYHSNFLHVLDCPQGWASYTASCYFLTEEALNFEDGADKCQQLNAHAVKIKDESENSDIKEYLASMSYAVGDWGYFTAYSNDTSGTWTAYDSSHTITFDNWVPDEPSYDNTENCLTYFLLMDLKWMDSPCSEILRMICEIDRI